MPTRFSMRHLVIMLLGIIGSVLQRNDHDVWALSGEALWQHLHSRGRLRADLRILDDDWQQPSLGDSIVATRLIEDLHTIPGLMRHAGYGPARRRLLTAFEVTEGVVAAPWDDANCYPFPCDWWRDVRAAARRLQRCVEQQLPRWRAWSGAADAQVICVAHSVGGLSRATSLKSWADGSTAVRCLPSARPIAARPMRSIHSATWCWL